MITKEKVVTCVYDMFINGEDENGNRREELMEQATAKRPLVYCHGEGMMLPKFEEALEGLEAGAKFDFWIMHEDAYGDYDEAGVMELDKKMFYNGDNEFDSDRVYEGAIVPMRTTDGQIVNAQVAHVGIKTVTIDLNHPFAGEDLHFVGEVLAIRSADPKELEAIRNPHKCGGCHGNCGDCGSDCGSNCNNCEK